MNKLKATFIKCPQCNTRNQDRDYCIKCGALINTALKRRMETRARMEQKIQKNNQSQPGKLEKLYMRLSSHPSALIRSAASAFYWIWTIGALIVGAIIAAAIALAAG